MTCQKSHRERKARMLILGIFAAVAIFFGAASQVRAGRLAQIPTVAVPTVTSSPALAIVTVTRDYDQVNLRSGPGAEYPIVGVIIAGAEVPALGRSTGGLWVQIVYPGGPGGVAWIYSPLLLEISGSLPIIEPPPTPTPQTTPTIDPTLAAQFIVEIPPTRLPTFTPPPPLTIPTFAPEMPVSGTGRAPMGLLITGMGILGVFGLFLSFLRGR